MTMRESVLYKLKVHGLSTEGLDILKEEKEKPIDPYQLMMVNENKGRIL